MVKKLGNVTGTNEMHNLQPTQDPITGFWTSRGESAIWDERVVRAEEQGTGNRLTKERRPLSGNCGTGFGVGNCGMDGVGDENGRCGGCGGGCGSCAG